MKPFTDSKVADPHANLNLPYKRRAYGNIKIKALKAVQSIAIVLGCMTVGVVAETAAQAATNHKSLSTADDRPVTVSSQTAAQPITADGNVTEVTRTRDGSTNYAQAPLQYGQVQLINDKPYPEIIYFRERGKGNVVRFAYLPGCTKRTLAQTYTNRWEYSGDNKTYTTFGTLAQSQFMLTTSHFQQKDNGLTCRAPSLLTPLPEGDYGGRSEWHKRGSEGIVAKPVVIAKIFDTGLKGARNLFKEAATDVGTSGTVQANLLHIGKIEGGGAGRAFVETSLTNKANVPTTQPNKTRLYIISKIEASPNNKFEAGTDLIARSRYQLYKNIKNVLQREASGDQSLVAERINAIASEVIEVAEKGAWTEDYSRSVKQKLIASVEDGGCNYVDINADLVVDTIRAYVQFVNVTRVEMGDAGGTPSATMISADRQQAEDFGADLRKLECAHFDRIPSVDGSLVVSQR